MHKTLLNSLFIAPTLLGAAVFFSAPVTASQLQSSTEVTTEAAVDTTSLAQLQQYSNEGQGVPTENAAGADTVDQVTSVSQLSDVQPTDWAFQALQSLVERYGCIAGYPDGTYKGNRAMTRYEFAAGVNACLDRVNELIAAGTTGLASKEDLATLQKLQEEFAAELATIRGQVDGLEARTTELEKNQFSTTTKLAGEVIFAVADTFGDAAVSSGSKNPRAIRGDEDNTETIFGDRVRLNFETSFTGKDKLRTRLEALNIPNFNRSVVAGEETLTGTNMTRLSFDGGGSNNIAIDELWYRFPLGNQLTVQVDAVKLEVYDALVDTLSPFASSGSGAISRFGRFNPIFRAGATAGAGVTARYKFSEFKDTFTLELGYVSDTNSNIPTEKNGLFNGATAAFANLIFKPNNNLSLGFTYSRGYFPSDSVNLTGSTGSRLAANPFNSSAANRRSVTEDVGAVQIQYKLSPTLTLGGWFGAIFANEQNSNKDATILNGAVYLSLKDLFKEGSLTGLLVGIPPKVVDNSFDSNREDPDTSIHVEAFHRFPVSDNIAITPGFFVIFNPEHNSDNATQFVGTIRTTFTF
ncbi:MAG: iron uptake porin [Scytolyngbya sp. HA4215-MV1]|nr:iron uptake porin [Scytolyngbya sp. HA4215-MV1]